MPASLRRTLLDGLSPLDVALALGLAAVGQVELRVYGDVVYQGSAPLAASSAAGLLASLPLAWRHRAPLGALATITAALIVPAMLFDTTALFYGGFFPQLVALYSASCFARTPRDRLALLSPVAIFFGLTFAVPAVRSAGQYTLPVGAWAGVWLAGQAARRWRATGDRLRHALEELDATAALRERGAVDDERARIARELHDVVGHSMSVMVLQAGAARLQLLPEQTRARGQLEAVEAAGREAMTEMRRLVSVMRPGDATSPLAAPPSLQRIEPLLQQMREAGLEIRLTVTGHEHPLPQGLDMSAYRIVQEALTNVARHAGPVPVDVEIAYEPSALRMEIRNGAPSGSGHTGRPSAGGGHGLLGMRERVALYGGSLEAGPCPDGGYVVRTRLLLDGAAA